MGEEASAQPVRLALYDLSGGMAAKLSASMGELLNGQHIEMVPHSGIRVFGREYFYSGAIQSHNAEVVEGWVGMKPVRLEVIGRTTKTIPELDEFVLSIRREWTVDSYDVMHHNCNDFAKSLASFLCDGKDMYPEWILRLPTQVLETPLGQAIEPMLRQSQAKLNERLREQQHSTKITVKRTSGVTETISVRPDMTVGELREKFGRLVYSGKLLSEDDSMLLLDVVAPGSTVIAAAGKASAPFSLSSLDTSVLQTLSKICANVIKHPAEPKYRTLKLDNAAFRKKVVDHSGALDVLKRAGFEVQDNSLHLEPSAAKWEPLNQTKHTIDAEIGNRQRRPRPPELSSLLPHGVSSPEHLTSLLQNNPHLLQSVQDTAQRIMGNPNLAQQILNPILNAQPPTQQQHQGQQQRQQPPSGQQQSNETPPEDSMTEEEALLEAIRRSLREQ